MYLSAFQTFRQSTYSKRNQITEGYERDGHDILFGDTNISATPPAM